MDLFVESYPEAHWHDILALRSQDTKKAKVFRTLIRGGWIPGATLEASGGGWDFRTRVSRLRDPGIPVESQTSATSACNDYRIPLEFLLAYEEMERRQRRTA